MDPGIFRAHYSAFRIKDSVRVLDARFMIEDSGFRIQYSGFRIQYSVFRVSDLNFRKKSELCRKVALANKIQDPGVGNQDSGFGIQDIV